jgi:hypothetical protein
MHIGIAFAAGTAVVALLDVLGDFVTAKLVGDP